MWLGLPFSPNLRTKLKMLVAGSQQSTAEQPDLPVWGEGMENALG